MKLISLEITSLGSNGWNSELLVFGTEITHLFAPNGAGKTPIIEAIIYGLGYNIKFRDDIYQRCDSVILTVLLNNSKIIFKRKIDRNEFYIEINEEIYTDARLFSQKFFQLINKNTQSLISSSNTEVLPYISQFLYLHYIDQDSGYIEIYNMPERFIKDQYSEMIRIALNLPAKNIFDHKKHQLKLENELKLVERKIGNLNDQINILKSNEIILDSKYSIIQEQLEKLTFEYEQLLSSSTTNKSTNNVYENMILIKKRELHDIQYEVNEIKKRQNSFKQISNEIQMELETLTLNEQAKRLFSSYLEICNNKSCDLFGSSRELYSKNLLYLKDQIKDLESNFESDSKRAFRLEDKSLSVNREIDDLQKKVKDYQEKTPNKSALSILVESINQLRLQDFLFKEINTFEKELLRQLERQKHLSNEIGTIKSRLKTCSQISIKKHELKELFIHWLDVLDTANINREITFETQNEFVPVLGKERINVIKGSTKTRCILAYKAAMFELMLKENNNLKFLILDTPKQQELDDIDLDDYMKALKKLATDNSAQIIFSSTDYEYDTYDNKDVRWQPKFEKQTNKGLALRYLIEN